MGPWRMIICAPITLTQLAVLCRGGNESIEIEMSIKYMYRNASKFPVKPKAQVLLYELCRKRQSDRKITCSILQGAYAHISCVRESTFVDLPSHALSKLIGRDHNGAGWGNFQASRRPATEQTGGTFFTENVHEEIRKGELLGR